RAAENLFWVGRYSQRVLRSSRFARIALRSLLQNGNLSTGLEAPALRALLKTLTHITGTYPGFLEMEDLTLEKCLGEIHSVVCVPEKTGGVLYTVNHLLKAMYAVRDRWPVDNWRIIDDMETAKERIAGLEPQAARLVFGHLDQLNGNLLSFLEMNRQSMYRGEGWTIYRIGQVVEEILFELAQYRALLSFEHEESDEFQILESLLLSSQNLTSYRSVYRTFFELAPALDLLFFNKQNPSSLISQLAQLRKYTDRLPKTANPSEIGECVFECYSLTRLMKVETLMAPDPKTKFRKSLDAFCEEIIGKTSRLSSLITSQYFSHSHFQVQGGQGAALMEV
ncbi:MAG: alpha-E domain-containing protein, partial [Spirochaetia bacterium]|nr:alpha-E domain-containing protein [Spirochaetia bacterium]